jgi:hypothetical protein
MIHALHHVRDAVEVARAVSVAVTSIGYSTVTTLWHRRAHLLLTIVTLCLLTTPVAATVQPTSASSMTTEAAPGGFDPVAQTAPPENGTDDGGNESNESVPGEVTGNVSGEGAFRFVAANDPDPARNNSTTEVLDVGAPSLTFRRNITTYNASLGLPPYELDRHDMTREEARNRSARTDGQRTMLNREVLVPIEERWVSLLDGRVKETRIRRDYTQNTSGENTILGNPNWKVDAYATTVDGHVPVRNAVVIVETFRLGDIVVPIRVVVPGTGEANIGEYRRYQERVDNGTTALMITSGQDSTADLVQSTFPTNQTVDWFVKGATENEIGGPGTVGVDRQEAVEDEIVENVTSDPEETNGTGSTNDTTNTSETNDTTATNDSSDQLASDTTDDEDGVVTTLAANQTENTTNGSSASPLTVNDYWDDDTYTVLADHWGGIARITPGAFLEGSFIVRDGSTRVFAPSDYRIDVPPDYEETYEYDGPDNDTEEELRATVYETWEVANLTVNKSVRIGSTEGEPGDPRGVFQFDGVSGERVEMESTVSLTLNHTYGIDITCETEPSSDDSDGGNTTSDGNETDTGGCEVVPPEEVEDRIPADKEDNSWEVVETISISHTVRQSHPLLIHDPENLSVEVYVLNKTINEIYITIEGEQSFGSEAIGTITVENGDRSFTLQSPWRFYPIALHRSINTTDGEDSVRYPTTYAANASERLPEVPPRDPNMTTDPAEIINSGSTTTEIRRVEGEGEGVPNLYRDYAEPEGWTVQNRSLEILAVEKNVTQNVSNEALPESVVRDEDPVPLYDLWGGFATNVSDENLSRTNASAVDIFGNPISAEVTQLQYKTTELRFEVFNDTVRIRLLSKGEPLANKELRVYGAEQTVVTTNEDGYATVSAESYVVRATYNGTSFQEVAENYYQRSSGGIAVPFFFVQPVLSVTGYLDAMISNIALIIEWILLGIVFYFGYRYGWGGKPSQE